MINLICTVVEIEDATYGSLYNPMSNSRNPDGTRRRVYSIKTEEGHRFSLTQEQIKGVSIGQKIRYSVTPLGAQETSELEDAYAVISDLVSKGKAAAERYAKAAKGNKALLFTQGVTLAALAWEMLK